MGQTIKQAKGEKGIVTSFGGVELNTAKIVISRPTCKLVKAQKLIAAAVNSEALKLIKLKTLTGCLNFVCIITPLALSFGRRLYNILIYFPVSGRQCRRGISSVASKDLRSWLAALAMERERSINRRDRETNSLWSDTGGRKGLRAFYIDCSQFRGDGEKQDTRQNVSQGHCREPHFQSYTHDVYAE